MCHARGVICIQERCTISLHDLFLIEVLNSDGVIMYFDRLGWPNAPNLFLTFFQAQKILIALLRAGGWFVGEFLARWVSS